MDAKISIILKTFKLEVILFSLLNFNEKNGILTTKSKGNIIESGIRNCKSTNNGNKSVLISGIATTKIAATGVGKPINEVVCRVSILKLAKRIAENIGISRAKISGKKKPSILASLNMILWCNWYIKWNKIIPGATPKVTISAMESNCFPSFPVTFSKRAASPSKKSKKAPAKMQREASGKLPWKEKIIAHNPQKRLVSVIIFGIFLLIAFISAKIW